MGPPQYLFLCGLLYTQTDGKFMFTSIVMSSLTFISRKTLCDLKRIIRSMFLSVQVREDDTEYPTCSTVNVLFLLNPCFKS